MASSAENSPLLDSAPPSSVEEFTDAEDPDIDHDRRNINGERPLREDGTS